jgi:thiamine pyrophosphokinase
MGTSPSSTIVVVAGGDAVDPVHLDPIAHEALVIAADSGIERATELGLAVDVAVGDFDSVSAAALAEVERAGAVVERHPEAKDATDLELALDAALLRHPERILVVGGHGGRLDHFLANAVLLAAPRYAGVELKAQMGPALVTVIRDVATLQGRPDGLVSLVPVHGGATGVTTEGLAFPLHGEDLLPGSTRGVSNRLLGEEATVRIGGGVLLAVQP